MRQKDHSPQQMLSDAMSEAVRLQGKVIAARKKLEALRRDAETCNISAGELPVRIKEIEEVLNG